MWFRAALFLIFWLLVYRFVMGVLRELSAPRSGRPPERKAPPSPRRPEWDASDVIDVPYQDVSPDAEKGAEKRQGK